MTMMMPATRTMSSVSETSTSTSAGGSSRTYRHEPYALNLVDTSKSHPATIVCYQRQSPRKRVSIPGYQEFKPRVYQPETPWGLPTNTFPLFQTVQVPVIPAGTPVIVSFKYGQRRYLANFPLQEKQLVVVEGDRGIDFGVVCGPAPAGGYQRLEKILRCANARDEAMDAQRAVKECEALEVLRNLAQSVECPACLEDVMLQLDGKKITVIISRDSRSFIDFRRLQRAAFDVYRCRVWFSYLDEIEETMSTDVSRPLRRPSQRKNSSNEAAQKRSRHLSSRGSFDKNSTSGDIPAAAAA